MGNQTTTQLSGITVQNGNCLSTQYGQFRLNMQNNQAPSQAVPVEDTTGNISYLTVQDMVITSEETLNSIASTVINISPCDFARLFGTVIAQYYVVSTLSRVDDNNYAITAEFTTVYVTGDPVELVDSLYKQTFTLIGTKTNITVPFTFVICDQKTNCISSYTAQITVSIPKSPNSYAKVVQSGDISVPISVSATQPSGTFPVFNNITGLSSNSLGGFTIAFPASPVLFFVNANPVVVNVSSRKFK